MKRSEYRKTTFDLPSNRRLWDTLGEFDALMQYVEAACISYEEKRKESGLSLEEFLRSEKGKMSHPISSLAYENPREKLHNLYLIYPHSCLDSFIDELIDDMHELGFTEFRLADTDKVSRLERLKTALERLGIKPALYDFSLSIYTYYRYVRNNLNHNGGNEDIDAKVQNVFKDLSKMKKDIEERFNYLDALRECNILNFGDYVLCTANIKNIADLMVVAVEKHVDWENFYLSVERHPTIKKINGYVEEKRVRYVQNTIRNTYSITLQEEICSKIVTNTIAYFDKKEDYDDE